MVQVLGCMCSLAGFWAPNITKLISLMEKLDGEFEGVNLESLYGLLDFYREYFPVFDMLIKLLCQILSQNAQLWMPEAWEYIHEVVWCVLTVPCAMLTQCRPIS